MSSDLQLVSRVLAEPFAKGAASKAAAYGVEKGPASKPLASTGSSAQDVETASAILPAGGNVGGSHKEDEGKNRQALNQLPS